MATQEDIDKAKADIANWKPKPVPEPLKIIRMTPEPPTEQEVAQVVSLPRGTSLRTLEQVNAGIDPQKVVSVINGLLEATTFVIKRKRPGDPDDAPLEVAIEVPDHNMREKGVRLHELYLDKYLNRDVGKVVERRELTLNKAQTPEEKAKNLFSSSAAMSVIKEDVTILLEAIAQSPGGPQLLLEAAKKRAAS
jgi:hypothetical protein